MILIQAESNYDFFEQIGINGEVDKEWASAFIAEQKMLFGKFPSSQFINESWEENKEYFLTREGKPFLTITDVK